MTRQIRDYIRPPTIEDALEALRRPGARAVAGGTDVILRPGADTSILVDLEALDLTGITAEPDGSLTIGAMTTLTDLLESEQVDAVATGIVTDMLIHVGSPLLRNVATIGGHLARGKLSDVVPVLIALDTTVALTDDGTRHTMTLADYYEQDWPKLRHLLLSIAIPHHPGAAGAFVRFARTAFDLALLNCSAVVTQDDAGTVTKARIVLGDLPALYQDMTEAAAGLEGRALDVAAVREAARLAAGAAAVGTDSRASADYRRHLAEVLTFRALSQVAATMGGAA